MFNTSAFPDIPLADYHTIQFNGSTNGRENFSYIGIGMAL